MNRAVIDTFHTDKPILGMLHLNGGTPEAVDELARREISQMYENGVDAVLVENYFGNTDDVERMLRYLQKEYPQKVYGVNVLGDPGLAFELAARYGAAFLQIDSVCGHLRPGKRAEAGGGTGPYYGMYDGDFADWLAGLRARFSVFLLGGVRFKYQPVNSGRSVEEDLAIGKERCDAVVVTGAGTGIETDMKKIRQFRSALGDFPLFVGAGMTEETCEEQLSAADGAIVGSWFKAGGVTSAPVDPARVRRFMDAVKRVRAAQP